eukprot:SAG31_NODE_2971_length_4839_cov_1.617722_3_plen_107_part_00
MRQAAQIAGDLLTPFLAAKIAAYNGPRDFFPTPITTKKQRYWLSARNKVDKQSMVSTFSSLTLSCRAARIGQRPKYVEHSSYAQLLRHHATLVSWCGKYFWTGALG